MCKVVHARRVLTAAGVVGVVAAVAMPAAAQPPGDEPEPVVTVADASAALYVDGDLVATSTEFTATVVDGEQALAYISPLRETAQRAGSTVHVPALGYVATHDAVTLTWSEFDQRVSEYRIYRDGDLIGTTSSTSWFDDDAPEGDANAYQVSTDVAATSASLSHTADGDLPYEEVEAPAKWATERYAPSWIDPAVAWRDLQDAPTPPRGDESAADIESVNAPHTVTAGTIARRPSARQSAHAAQAAAEAVILAASKSTFRYNTFIPSATAPGFPCTLNGGYFSGDNRSWHPEGAYRTRVEVAVPWHTSAQPTFAKSISPTRLYNSSGQFVEQRTASAANITYQLNLRDVFGEFAQFTVNHYATNPFCPTGGISYSIQASMSYTNDYWLDGTHRKAPNHEVYIKPNNSSVWYGVYHLANAGFSCLANDLLCGGRATYGASGNATP